MLDCLIVGDSIAVGIHQFKKECKAVAKGGINSWQFNRDYKGEFYSDNVLISLGSNDHKGVNTKKELENLRSRVLVKNKVYWVLPANKENIREIVKEVAQKYGDVVLPITKLQADGVHPSWAGYKELGNSIN